MISGIIKVEVSVISRSRRLRQITLTETLIIPDITKTESNNCFITGLPVWQTQSESGWDLFVFFFFFFFFFPFFFRVGKSLACHSPAKWYLCA